MSQQPIYKPDQEALLMKEIWSQEFYQNPYAFIMFVLPWGQEFTPLHNHAGPRNWQKQVMLDLSKHIKANNGVLNPQMLRMAIASSRGIGKSALLSWIALWFLATRVGASTLVSANGEQQLLTITFPEISRWVSMSIISHWFEVSAMRITPANWLSALVERDLKIAPKGWFCSGRLWSRESPDAFAGLHSNIGVLLIMDESSGIPDEIYSVSTGFFTEKTENRFWICCSNPRRNTGAFYDIFHGKGEYWNTRQINGYDVEGIDHGLYDQIVSEYGEYSTTAQVEVYGNFPADDDESFISPMLVKQAMKREQYKDETAPIVMGVDPAGTGADSTVVVVRQGRDLVDIIKWQGVNTMETVGRIIELIEEHKPVICAIDCGGIGAGIVDRLKEQRYKIREVNFGWKSSDARAYLNKRSEIWAKMREWLPSASLPDDKRLLSDLTNVRSLITSNGAIQLESKKDLKSRGLPSTDYGDALALTFAFSVAHREAKGIMKRGNNYQSQNSSVNLWMGS